VPVGGVDADEMAAVMSATPTVDQTHTGTTATIRARFARPGI
jgi:hypothetical protein